MSNYDALQSATTSDLGHMPEFVAIANKVAEAYAEYYESSTALECIVAFHELGQLSQRYGIEFDLVQLQLDLFTLAEKKYWRA